MGDSGEAIGIDVGGTKILAVRVGREGAVRERAELVTPAEDEAATLAAMIEAAKGLLTTDVLAVGVGAAGMVDVAEGILRFAPNLAWRNVPIAARMHEALGLPVQLDNDANVAAYGEYRFGAGRGYRLVLLVTVGTGLGGGIVSDGRLVRGANGFAAEVGHVVVQPDGPPCGCGNAGCWEQMASGTAIGRLGREEALERPGSLVLSMAGGDPEAVTGRIVTEAALAGDGGARRILGEVGRWLGIGLAGLANVLDPQVIVVGGGSAAAGDLLLEPARAAFAGFVEGVAYRPRVPLVAAELGTDAGAVGAAALALEELGRLP